MKGQTNNFTGPTSGQVIEFAYVLELRLFSENVRNPQNGKVHDNDNK